MKPYQKEFLISSYEVDFEGVLRLRSLFNLFQNMADDHAQLLGVGYHYCQQNGIGWIGGAYDVLIERLPRWGETVVLRTWPSKAQSATAIREFEMATQSGEVLVRASSQWVLLDIAKKRPIPVIRHLGACELLEKRCVETLFPKLPAIERTDIEAMQVIRFDDIDLNCHVNNAVYPTWILDALPVDFERENRLKRLKIQYKYPAQKGDTVRVLTQVDKTTLTHVIQNDAGDVEFARLITEWCSE